MTGYNNNQSSDIRPKEDNPRLTLAVLLPFIACAVQWLLWDTLKPYVWFLFFPAAFFSAWIGGLKGGLAATIISTLLVWYFFIPPTFSFTLDNPASAFSIVVFVIMGGLFAFFFERLQQSKQRTDEALAEAKAANEKISQLYQKTLELDTLKSQFFANVSHELRTPLTLILAPLERRLRRPASPDFSEAERHETEIMLRNARQLYRHVTDLLDAAKLEAGRMTLAWARLDLAKLVRTMASHFESLAAERHIDYAVIAPEALLAEADGEKLQRVLLNLLSNAFKFTPDGGAIVLRLAEKDGYALIEVQDNGSGVAPALREAVFERFRQGEGNAQRRHGGTGLGLAIVKDFVELHDGAVRLDEASGGGALFSVRLPLTAPTGTVLGTQMQLDDVIDRQTVEELEVRVSPSGEVQTATADAPLVLVVEDNVDMNEFIASTLRPRYRVSSAFNGREGIDKALALHPDLILSDVMMPVMSGDEMVVALRHQHGMDNVPIVMLTAKADDNLRMRMLKEGVQDYLNKPFSTEELLVRVDGLVASRRRTVDELSRSEAALKEAQRLANIGNWMWETRNNTHSWSEEIYHIYGRDPALPPAIYPEVQQYFTPESWARLAAAVEKSMAEGIAYECDAEVVRPDGSHRWITARGDATRDADGNIVNLHGTVQDITVRKQAEEEILHLNADLERRVLERTAELTVANRELDSFAYAVSHDLRAPLRAMSGFSQALAEDFGDQLPSEAKVYLEQINLASFKMSELIDGLLTLSRCTRGELQYDVIDISDLAERLLVELAQSDPERQVTVKVEAGLQTRGDARMIEVVMHNLLGNAWKYSMHAAAPSIRMYGEERDGTRRFCVADNGAGFDMAHSNRLFQPFQRLHRQEEFPGIGIGLATVQRIVHRHGGVIEPQGEPGMGATFCFTLSDMPMDTTRDKKEV